MTDDTSLLTNLKNKVIYNVHKSVYDPNANKFVEEQEKQKQKLQKSNTEITDTRKDSENNTEDLTKFSTRRVFKKIGNQALTIIKTGLIPFIALMLAMIVANEMIVYAVPIRILFFIFTFLVCFFATPICIILSIFYLFKGGYSYYLNNMIHENSYSTDSNKRYYYVMPTIFALLPITTYKPVSPLGSLLLYPFTYPKTENALNELPKIMNQYWLTLQSSFLNFNKFKNIPVISNRLQLIQKELSDLHSSYNTRLKE